MRRRALGACALALLLAAAAGSDRAGTLHPPRPERVESRLVPASRAAGWTLEPEAMKAGVVLGLFSQERGHDYGPGLREIRELGAGWAALLVVEYQPHARSVSIGPDARRTPERAEVARAVRQAHALGLRVLLLPIVVLASSAPAEWRGNIQPESVEEWFCSYRQMLLGYAELSEREGVEALSVGSELCSMERHTAHWRALISDVRARYGGLLTYSANWDHTQAARFYDALDFVGVSAYFSLTPSNTPTLPELLAAWRPIVAELDEWRRGHGQPIAFLEVGYPSVDGANADPWNYKLPGGVDLEEQALCFEALRRVFGGSPLLSGLFVYNWYEPGGPGDRSYTPRGKPAEAVVRALLRELAGGPVSLTPSD
jgi:hypothetical protein